MNLIRDPIAPPHTAGAARVSYALSGEGWFGYYDYLCALASRPEVRRVCEIGGGANPALPIAFVREHGLDYTVLDLSAEELDKAPEGYEKVHADIMNPGNISGGFDLVFSRFVAEHVRSGRVFHANVRALLADGGLAFHYFPTLFTLPYILNRLVPEWLSEGLLHAVQGGRDREGRHGKFPAYYSWCYGPTAAQIRRFEEAGYTVEEFIGYYGHSYYRRIPPLHWLHERLNNLLVHHPIPQITTMAYVLLRRRSDADTRIPENRR